KQRNCGVCTAARAATRPASGFTGALWEDAPAERSHRMIHPRSVLRLSTPLAAVACVAPMPNVAAAQAVPDDLTVMPPVPTDYQPKKTAWGDPDLRGSWPIDSIASLPRNRPANSGDRFLLTEEEFAQRQVQA